MKKRYKFLLIIFALILVFFLGIFFNIDKARIYLKRELPPEIKIFLKEKFFGKDYIKELAYYRMSNYNQKILPQTQFQDILIEEHELKQFTKNKRFFIEKFNDKLIAINTSAKIIALDLNDLNKKEEIKNNLVDIDLIEVFDFKFYKDEIFIIVKRNKSLENKCAFLIIFKSKFETDKKLNFKKFYETEECTKGNDSAKIEIGTRNEKKGIFIATSASTNHGLAPDEKFLAENDNSIFGKILFIDFDKGEITQVAKGIRNPKSLYNYNNLILFTDSYNVNGDEINFLKEGQHYGWPISSYGEEDNIQNILEKDADYVYKKNHSSFGYQEPIISFYPSIEISSIIKIPDTFSRYWKNNFLITSNSSIYRAKFDKKFSKILFFEKIVIKNPSGDVMYLKRIDKLLLASAGKLLIMSKK